ncbi:MAG: hypothetical protein ABR909_12445 [Candidatus Bathyarchaeia archaeon]|jgi:hypothetical protein
MSQDKSVTWKREEQITVPTYSQERRIAIRYLDWDRCKRRLSKARNEKPRLDLVFSFLFGITATSGFSIATFYAEPHANLPNWAYPFFYLLLVFSLGTGFVFVYLDRKLNTNRESEIDDIINEMESIEKTFPEVAL